MSITKRLVAIENERRPVSKIVASQLEGYVGKIIYNKFPPKKDNVNLLHLGCGDYHFPQWVNADYYRFSDTIRKKNRKFPDWMLDAASVWKCNSDYWDGIYTEHTFEHLNYSGVINALRESYRTLKSSAWIRIVLPGLEQFLAIYNSHSKAEAVAKLTQTFGHISVWDEELLCELLQEIGFVDVKVVSFGEGSDKRLIKDLERRASESLYVKAKKP